MGSVPAPAANGKSLFATHRVPAWHGLAEPFQKVITDWREMMREANMDTVEYSMVPASLPAGVDRFITPTNHVVWTNPATDQVEVVGTVGDRYHIIPLEDTFQLLGTLGAGKRFETAGIINDGRVAFASIADEQEFVIDPTGVADRVKRYILASTSFDGSTGLRLGKSAVRVVCENTLDVAWQGAEAVGNVRHTLNFATKIAKVKAEFEASEKYFAAAEAEANTLFAQKVTDAAFWGLVEAWFPKPEENKKGAQTKYDNKMGLIAQAWQGAPNAGIKNTAWGAFNALTEANQWGRNVQAGRANGQENFWKAGAGFDTATTSFRNEALARVKALA